MAFGAVVSGDLAFDRSATGLSDMQGPRTMAAFTTNIDAITGLADAAKSARFIKASAVAANAGVIVGSTLLLKGRPRLGVRGFFPQIISLGMAALTG